MNTMTYRAQMAQRSGRWLVYVVHLGVPDAWPEAVVSRTRRVPTLNERTTALEALGYALGSDAEWQWTEYCENHDDPCSRVVLVAYTTVWEVAA